MFYQILDCNSYWNILIYLYSYSEFKLKKHIFKFIYVICVCLRIVMSNTAWLYERHCRSLIRGWYYLPFGRTWVDPWLLVASWFLCIVYIRPVSCVSNVVHSWLPLRFSLKLIYTLGCLIYLVDKSF